MKDKMQEKEQNQEKNQRIEEIIRTYGDEILRLLYLYVKDLDTAKDLFQDTFVKVHMGLKDFRSESNIKTWITRIAINTAKDYLKSAWNRKVSTLSEYDTESEIDIRDENTRVEETVVNKDIRKNVRDAVLELKEEYKEVITCVYFLEMSIETTANQLSIPPGTVKSRLSRARSALKEILERRGLQ